MTTYREAIDGAERMLERLRVWANTHEESDAVEPEEIGAVLRVLGQAEQDTIGIEEAARLIEEKVRPLIQLYDLEDGYNCCGCSTYDMIVDDVIRVIRGYEPQGSRRQ